MRPMALLCTVACAHAEPAPEPVRQPHAGFVQAAATCAPSEPQTAADDAAWRGLVLLDYVVHENGAITDVRAEVLDGKPGGAEAVATVKEWINSSCLFAPAKVDGVPASVELGQVIQFGPSGRQVPMLQAGMTRPTVAACRVASPRLPRESLLGGTVLVQYVVETDGQVSDIQLKALGPVAYFRAVRDWLSGCRFQPATEEGRAVAVRMVQPFVFQLQ